jgi:signal transduction histidine kinase
VLVLRPGRTKFQEVPEAEKEIAEIESSIGTDVWISSFREDAKGAIWMGLASRKLVHAGNTRTAIRYRDGEIRAVSTSEGLPRGDVNAIHRDKKGRLWFATQAGVAQLDDPAAAQLSFRRYSVTDGISSDEVWWIESDDLGRIYVCTAKGIDRLNLDTGRIRHFTTDDGLPRGRIYFSLKDHSGRMWFSSENVLTHFDPEPEVARPPGIFLVKPSGPLALPYDKAFLQAEFSSPRFSGGPPRFQYRLAGAGEDWGPPTPESAVRYAGLGSGDYELQARALDDNGLVSEKPASLHFSVAPPFWRTWWFLTLALVGIAAIAYRLHLNRVARLLAVERLRLRIAADLHDDVGSNLAHVSMLGELAGRALDGTNPKARELIERMAATSRETIEAMGDIVWSIHPKNDRLSDMIQRMTGFAADVLAARDIDFAFDTPSGDAELALPIEVRRDLLLIFKEAINNAARHASCTKVRASLAIVGDRIRLAVEDDGRGLPPGAGSDGHGLADIRARAEGLGGEAEIENLPGGGVAVRAVLPLAYTNK